MGNNIAFQAQGRTYQANATVTSQRILVQSDVGCNQVLVSSHENQSGTGRPVFFRISSDSGVTVAVPTAGNPEYCLMISPGAQKVFTVPQQFTPAGLYIAFITDGGTPSAYFTPGEGL